MLNHLSRKGPMLVGTGLALLGVLPAQQPTPCPPAIPQVMSYDCRPIGMQYSSIAGMVGTVTAVFADADDATVLVPFPAAYAFAFYGVAQASIVISTNGNAHFGAASAAFANQHVGDNTAPNNAIYPWRDDLHLTTLVGPGFVYYRFDLTAGAESLTIQWNSVRNYPGTAVLPLFSFQAVLYASTHTTLRNVIDFRYDRTTQPSMPACIDTLQAAPSATVGLEPNLTAPSTPPGAIDCTGRGAGNAVFPLCDLRMTPMIKGEAMVTVAMNVLAQRPFCSIVPMAGTLVVPNTCTAAQPCTDDDNSAATMGAAIRLPWKVNFAGRHFKNANMNSNGLLGLGQGNFGTNSANGLLPAGGTEPDLMLAPFWDSLEGTGVGAPSGMFFRVDGAPGCRVATFEWANMALKTGLTGDCVGTPQSRVSFQVKIFEGSAAALVPSVGLCPNDTVLPGVGNDRIEFWYDHANFGPAAYTATIGWEDATGATGAMLPPSPAVVAFPLTPSGAPGKVVLETCDTGQVRYYGNPGVSGPAPVTRLPEMSTNCVAPVLGNRFALTMHGSSPNSAVLLLIDIGGAIPGTKTPVPCGGIPTPGGIAFVNPGSPGLFTFFAGFSGPGIGCALYGLPIPPNPALIGFTLYAQWAVLVAGPGFLVETSEAIKVVVGA